MDIRAEEISKILKAQIKNYDARVSVAETGTVVLTDSETSDRLGALAPMIHIAVLDPKRLVRSIAQAIAQFGDDARITFANVRITLEDTDADLLTAGDFLF